MTVEVLAADRAGLVDDLGWEPAGALDAGEIKEELRGLRRRIACLEAREAELVDSAARRGVPQQEGFGSTASWLMAVTGDPPYVCRSRVQTARALRQMPLAREAFAAGEVSEPRVRLLAAAWEFAPAVFSRDEAVLVQQARILPAKVFPRAVAHWRRLADADGALADAERAVERRRLYVSATWGGMVRLDGDLDPESGQTVLTALGSLAEPWSLDPDDRRSPAQRRADALVEICRRHLDTSDRPRVGGERPHLTVTVDLATLQGRGEPVADLECGPISLQALQRLACDATLSPIVTGPDEKPLVAGRRTRVISPALRRALHQRDQHCTHPGCDVPARWCDTHHQIHWVQGGKTELANLRLLCRRHHREAHDHGEYPQRE